MGDGPQFAVLGLTDVIIDEVWQILGSLTILLTRCKVAGDGVGDDVLVDEGCGFVGAE